MQPVYITCVPYKKLCCNTSKKCICSSIYHNVANKASLLYRILTPDYFILSLQYNIKGLFLLQLQTLISVWQVLKVLSRRMAQENKWVFNNVLLSVLIITFLQLNNFVIHLQINVICYTLCIVDSKKILTPFSVQGVINNS